MQINIKFSREQSGETVRWNSLLRGARADWQMYSLYRAAGQDDDLSATTLICNNILYIKVYLAYRFAGRRGLTKEAVSAALSASLRISVASNSDRRWILLPTPPWALVRCSLVCAHVRKYTSTAYKKTLLREQRRRFSVSLSLLYSFKRCRDVTTVCLEQIRILTCVWAQPRDDQWYSAVLSRFAYLGSVLNRALWSLARRCTQPAL